MKKQLIFAVDYDGTCVSNEYPSNGKDIGAAKILKQIVDAGHQIMLYTCRSNHDDDRILFFDDGSELFLPAGNDLDIACDWFDENNIPIIGVNWNPVEADYDVEKPHFDILIDDKAFGVPLTRITIVDDEIISSDNPFVDWQAIEIMLINRGLI